jgi:DNA-binding IclR family transcriptional regulator
MARSVKSAERTLALFELFSMRQRPLTVGRIASELEMPQASASMLLANLRELGYVTYDRLERTYTPTIRVALLGSWINHQFDEAGSLTARLTELQDRVDETVFVGIQNGAYGQYVLVLHRHKVRSMQIRSGQFKLLTASAMGRVLLSLKTDEEVLQYVRRCNAEAQEARLRVVASEFLGVVEQVRRTGYAQTRGDVTPTFGAIAVTLPAPMGLMPMAIGVGVPVERMEAAAPNIIDTLNDLKADFAALARTQSDAIPQVSSAA